MFKAANRIHTMLRGRYPAFLCLFVSICLGSCAATDQFASRVYSGNINSQTALDQETLLNIVRASRFQPLTFVAVTKSAGNQTSDLRVGVPTVAFGPGSEVINARNIFTNNLFDNRVGGYFEANPLISSVFQQGMMTPLSVRTVALLFGAHPREPVLYAAIESIGLRSTKGSILLKNNPSDNSLHGVPNDEACRALETGRALGNGAVLKTLLGKDCNYSAFVFALEESLAAGLTTELTDPAKPDHAGSKDDSPSKESNAVNIDSEARLCLGTSADAASTRIIGGNQRCGLQVKAKPTFVLALDGETYGLEYHFRSPLGIYAYLGRLLRDGVAGRVRMQDPELGILREHPFVAIDGAAGDCAMAAQLSGGTICVPVAHGASTLMLIDILEALRNLSIAPSDLAPSMNSN